MQRNYAPIAALSGMQNILRKPVVIAAIVAALGVTIMVFALINHTYLIVDRRLPQSPPGTTFNAVNDAGAAISPTTPESKIKVLPMGPTPFEPPSTRAK